MELSPKLYKWLVRPKWFSNYYINDIIRDEFDFNNRTVLDFGCGIGSCCSLFSPDSYLGVDRNPKRIDYARKHFPCHEFLVSSGHSIPLAESSVDYILVMAVIHHMPKEEVPLYLNEFKRLLKPDGRVIVIEPCFFKDWSLRNLLMGFFDRGKHISSEDGYLELFRASKYRVEIHNRYKQLLLYNKVFFSASPND